MPLVQVTGAVASRICAVCLWRANGGGSLEVDRVHDGVLLHRRRNFVDVRLSELFATV